MFENYSPAARALLGRSVVRCPSRIIGLDDVVAVLDTPDVTTTVHLPPSSSWAPNVRDAFARAELAARGAGDQRVGLVYLLAGIVDIGIRTNALG